MKAVKIYGHRGSSGGYPENTLLSFQKAVEEGVDGIELDVQLTKDQEVVIIHDTDLDRLFGVTGAVHDYTLAELKTFPYQYKKHLYPLYEEAWEAERIPTLEEVLLLLQGTSVELNIELKTLEVPYPMLVEKVLELVNLYGEGRRVVYSAFHFPTLYQLKKLDHTSEVAFLDAFIMDFPIPRIAEYVEALNLQGLHLEKNMLLANNPSVEMDDLVDVPVRLWTVNEEAEMEKAFDLPIEAIITDFPAKAGIIRQKRWSQVEA